MIKLDGAGDRYRTFSKFLFAGNISHFYEQNNSFKKIEGNSFATISFIYLIKKT
jgi:hypothetical protein